MQKALSPLQLYINVSREADKPEWVSYGGDGTSKSSADIREVPGPCGAKELHLGTPGYAQPRVGLLTSSNHSSSIVLHCVGTQLALQDICKSMPYSEGGCLVYYWII